MQEFVDILGTSYKICFGNEKDYPSLKENDAFTDTSVKMIVVDDFKLVESDPIRKANIPAYQKQLFRHEIIHAFLAESGLDGNGQSVGHWEFNEEMVDWFAIQSPKIFKVFKKLELL